LRRNSTKGLRQTSFKKLFWATNDVDLHEWLFVMKWLLLAVSLLALWVSFNALYMVPGRYTAFNFEVAGIGIAIGILTALLSGKRFVDVDRGRRTKKAIMLTPPLVLCTFILLVFCVMAGLKIIASG
jgi:hypothetical protein